MIAKAHDHFVQFFERDEPSSVKQFVLVNRLRQLGNIRVVGVVPIRELSPFDSWCITVGRSSFDELRFFLLGYFLH